MDSRSTPSSDHSPANKSTIQPALWHVEGARRGPTIFGIESAPFHVVITDVAPEDELRVRNNTGLLLDVLRVMDETHHALESEV